MKHVKWMLTMAITLTSFSGLGAAQSNYQHGIVAQVPFEFKVGNKFVPAGRCEILTTAENRGSLTIRNVKAKTSTIVWASLRESKEAAGTYALVFDRYGDQYFLTGIRLEGRTENYKLPETKAEAELRAQNAGGTEEVFVAALK
jgi:hypothetical protein